MENSKEKKKSNIVVIVLISIFILLLLLVATILLVQTTGKSILLNGKDSNIEEHTSNKPPVENIPVNNSIHLNNDNTTGNNGSSNNSIPNTYGGEDENPIPNTYGGADVVKESKTISLNNVNRKIDISCICEINEQNDDFTVYTTNYVLTIDGNRCYGFPKLESILPDNPQPEDCFTITKIADKNTNKEYLVLQAFSHWISGTNVSIFIIDDDLEIFGSVEHIAGTSFIINNSVKDLELYHNYISDYTWDDEGVAHHVYSIQNGKFVDSIEKIYKDGEYEVSGRS